jgi:hypothetical protein
MGGGALSLLKVYGSAAIVPGLIVEGLVVAPRLLLLRWLIQEGV